MKIITENNAFQNIEKCLNKKCNSIEQIEDFLQYCIEFIFYEETYIAGTVRPEVIQDTGNVISLLKSKYFKDKDMIIEFEYLEDNTEKAQELIQNVSRLLSQKYIEIFLQKHKRTTESEDLGLFPKFPDNIIAMVKDFTKLINDKNVNILTGEYSERSKFNYDSGFYKILNSDSDIYEKIFKFTRHKKWNDAMSFNLLSIVRILTNIEMAIMNKKIFLPSVKRSRVDYSYRLIPEQIPTIPERVDSIINKTGNLIGALKMPSLKDYIIEKSKGSPDNILKITNDLRNHFKGVRDYICEYGKSGDINNLSALNEIANELYEKINKGTIYERKMVLENTYTHSAGISSFSASITFKDNQTLNRKDELYFCVEAFTEIAQNMLNHIDHGYMKELVKNCLK